jgi:hypothetical protein
VGCSRTLRFTINLSTWRLYLGTCLSLAISRWHDLDQTRLPVSGSFAAATAGDS